MSMKNEIETMGIAEGFISALSAEDVASKARFEELVLLIMDLAEVDEELARYYANGYWKISDMKSIR